MSKKKTRHSANFTSFGYLDTMLPVMTDESRSKVLEYLNTMERPQYLFGKEVLQDFGLLNYGQYSDLCDAMGGTNDLTLLRNIVKAVYTDVTDEQIDQQPATDIYGFCNFAAKEVDKINQLFGDIHVERTDEERKAGIDRLQFGTFGILDWYAKRMGITDQNEVNSVAWVRIYTCMKNDSDEVAFNRRLQKVYNDKIKQQNRRR